LLSLEISTILPVWSTPSDFSILGEQSSCFRSLMAIWREH
jgi:hypothetical protein